MSNLASLLSKYESAVFFDVETTGLDYQTDRIIELAAIRIEKNRNGEPVETGFEDVLVQLPEGEKIPDKIVQMTGITDRMLATEGIGERDAAKYFATLIGHKPGNNTLLVAHNAQFDLMFTRELLLRQGIGVGLLVYCDYLDSLTVYKDRRAYPHKLADAIAAYGLEGKAKNSHRAIDDTAALVEVCKAMDNERADLHTYVNVFGYNPKYGVKGDRLPRVTYWPQHYNNHMQPRSRTLPELARRK